MKPSNQALPQLNQIPYPAGSSDARKLKDKLAYAGLGPADEFMAQVSLLAEEKYQVYDPGSKKAISQQLSFY